jgi:CRP-like cAMP-binding protein
MKLYEEALGAVNLFKGIASDDLVSMLDCLQAHPVQFKKGKHLLRAGERPAHVGVVLSGRLHVVKDDADGNHTLLAALGETDIFAEALCCAGVAESPVTVIADTDVTVMLLGFSRILSTCSNTCAFHQKLIENMLRIVAQKNLYLQDRMDLIRTKSVRTKVLAYLGIFAKKRGTDFTIPLNREEMADYLCVDRSALSHELIRMKRDGLISYRKNSFTLL